MPKSRLIDALQEEEKQEMKDKEQKQRENTSNVKRPVEQIVSKDGVKDKQISAKVNMKIYDAFTKINKLQGISNNSALNMLITKYVRENKDILDEDNIF